MWKRAIFAAIVVSLMGAAAYASLFIAPTERTMGTLQRIFYFHAAAAWAGMTAFSITVTCRGGSPHRALGYLQLHYDDGSERRATEVCRDYLGLLQCMVANFEVANP